MYEFYKTKGYRASFVMNTINIPDKEKYMTTTKNNAIIKIGLYSSGDRWVKNTYNQLSAVSLFDNAELNCIPLNTKVRELAGIFNINISGDEESVDRETLFKQMAGNDVNLYVTFTECAPLIPLESLELGVPCITGDNHHYFEGTELEEFLVVNKEDNIMAIYEKIKYVLENKEKIIELYNELKTNYIVDSKKSIEDFLK